MRGMAMSRRFIGLTVMTAALLALLWASPAGARELVEFESKAALAANGPIPKVPANPLEEVKEVCGSETQVFGSELLTGTPPSEIKVKNEWGDIVAGKDMMVSGKISHVEESGGDLSFDHPFSRDFTFDVVLDEPYWPLARKLGPGAREGGGEHELHMELEYGQLLHALPQLKGPAEGESWLSADKQAHEHVEAAYIPQEGDRIATRGRWIIDCGHNDFHTELHPITFMAFGHAVGSKTVVHVLSNPYRVTELYGFGTGEVNSSSPKGTPFPQALAETIGAVTKKSVEGFPAAITLATGIERTQPSTAPWFACKPTSGKPPILHQNFVFRKGVKVAVKRLASTHQCAIAEITVGSKEGGFGSYTALQPPSRTCGFPYPLADAEVAGGLGVAGHKVNEIERIAVNASGGTFTISHGGDETGHLPFNASHEEVQNALEGLASIGPGNVIVIGGPGGEGGGTPYTVIFVGSLGEKAITPLTTDHSGLTPSPSGPFPFAFLATVVVLQPGGELDLHRFILSLIEQRVKAELEYAEEHGNLVGAIGRIEANVERTPQVACLDPLSAPLPNPKQALFENNQQPFPYYGEVVVE
jgi:hypothetical protein